MLDLEQLRQKLENTNWDKADLFDFYHANFSKLLEALEIPNDNYTRKATIVRVVDGDTVIATLELGWDIALTDATRLLRIDTPELKGPERPEGLRYKQIVEEWFAKNPTFWLKSVKYERDKYGRSLIEIYSLRGESLNSYLKNLLEQ